MAGWATLDEGGDGLAHEIVEDGAGPGGTPVRTSLCGQFSGPNWSVADIFATRCPTCQNASAGTPD